MSKAVLSLPESSPAFLLQALIPSLGFNGHEPVLFIKGEGWLKTSVVNKINIMSTITCLPVQLGTAFEQSPFDGHRERLMERAIHNPLNPIDTGPCPEGQGESIDGRKVLVVTSLRQRPHNTRLGGYRNDE
jgi:hypothetical protein